MKTYIYMVRHGESSKIEGNERTRGLTEKGKIDAHIYHFCLLATDETLHERLKLRGDTLGGWTFQQISKCNYLFSERRYEEHIRTDHIGTAEVVDRILTRIRQ